MHSHTEEKKTDKPAMPTKKCVDRGWDHKREKTVGKG